MDKSKPDFRQLEERQKSLLNDIESLKAELNGLSPGNLDRSREIHQKIDYLTVKAVRFLVKNVPGGDRSSGLFRLFIDKDNQASIILANCLKLHPMAPDWFVEHFWDWRQRQRLQPEGREILRETRVVGLESCIKDPQTKKVVSPRIGHLRNMDLLKRVLELRGVKEESDPSPAAVPNDPPLGSLREMKEKLRQKRRVTDEMLQALKKIHKGKQPKEESRTRKNSAPWNRVIEKLVEEGLLPKKISHQALKKRLRNKYPDYPWDKV
jgi:hypothetical protein